VGGEAVTKLVTIATPNIQEQANGFLINQAMYAVEWGYVFERVQSVAWSQLHPSFSKVFEIDRALAEGFEFVIWADADVAFMDFNADLTKILKPEHFLTGYQQNNWKTWKYICNGLLVIRNCEGARNYVTEWADHCVNGCPLTQPGIRTMIRDHPWEQWSFDALIRHTNYHGIYAATAQEIGCFCPEIWHDGIIWQAGMPTIHMAGPASWEKRADVFEKIYRKKVIRKKV